MPTVSISDIDKTSRAEGQGKDGETVSVAEPETKTLAGAVRPSCLPSHPHSTRGVLTARSLAFTFNRKEFLAPSRLPRPMRSPTGTRSDGDRCLALTECLGMGQYWRND